MLAYACVRSSVKEQLDDSSSVAGIVVVVVVVVVVTTALLVIVINRITDTRTFSPTLLAAFFPPKTQIQRNDFANVSSIFLLKLNSFLLDFQRKRNIFAGGRERERWGEERQSTSGAHAGFGSTAPGWMKTRRRKSGKRNGETWTYLLLFKRPTRKVADRNDENLIIPFLCPLAYNLPLQNTIFINLFMYFFF